MSTSLRMTCKALEKKHELLKSNYVYMCRGRVCTLLVITISKSSMVITLPYFRIIRIIRKTKNQCLENPQKLKISVRKIWKSGKFRIICIFWIIWIFRIIRIVFRIFRIIKNQEGVMTKTPPNTIACKD